MTITLDLPQETLIALQADARAQGRPPEQLAVEHLAIMYAPQDDERASIEEALGELEAGQGRPFSEFVADFTVGFDVRYGKSR